MYLSSLTHLKKLDGPILLTGHTGFKGTWMSFLLEKLEIPVIGYSLPPVNDSLFTWSSRLGVIPETFSDIRDYETLREFIFKFRPSAIIHMAAQPLVLESYKNPLETFQVNATGTANILDIASRTNFVEAIIVVTTDKVYRNENYGRAFTETDPLEGKDPYSASKVGAEAAVTAWQSLSRFSESSKIVSVRSGNVVGGGDWAYDRLIPDLIRGYLNNEATLIRSIESTRPWQHVLDPLRGYLLALEYLLSGGDFKSMNFGPSENSLSVSDVIDIGRKHLDLKFKEHKLEPSTQSREANLLSLDAKYAYKTLGWELNWSQEVALERTFSFWSSIISQKSTHVEAISADFNTYFETPS